jgi:pimeloyl-ACP methyl ester carboxylesterase
VALPRHANAVQQVGRFLGFSDDAMQGVLIGCSWGCARVEGRTFDLFPARSRIQCPTLVLRGEDDPMIPIEAQEDIAAALPKPLVRFERFPNCGHSVIADTPERAFAAIRDFIMN